MSNLCVLTDGFADELTQKRYLECVTSTRLLAKFLAFAEFLPYHGSEEYSEQVMSLHRAVRQKVSFLKWFSCRADRKPLSHEHDKNHLKIIQTL